MSLKEDITAACYSVAAHAGIARTYGDHGAAEKMENRVVRLERTAEKLSAATRVYMVCGEVDGVTIYLSCYTADTYEETATLFMRKARDEGFRGRIDERLKELGLRIAPMIAFPE